METENIDYRNRGEVCKDCAHYETDLTNDPCHKCMTRQIDGFERESK